MFQLKYRSAPGQALVEFALVIGIVLMFIFVIIESARYLQAWQTVQNAAQEGARYALTGQFEPDCLSLTPPCQKPRVVSIKKKARDSAKGLPIDPQAGYNEARYFFTDVIGLNERDEWEADFPGLSNRPVMVRVTYRMPIIAPFLRPFAKSVRVIGQVIVNNEEFERYARSGGGTPPIIPPPPPPEPPLPNLIVSQVATPQIVGVEELIYYAINVHNDKDAGAIATGTLLTFTLPMSTTLNNYPGSCGPSGQTLLCNLGDIAINGSVNLAVSVFAPPLDDVPVSPWPLPNHIIAMSNMGDKAPSDNVSQLTVHVLWDGSDLEIISNVGTPNPVVVGSPVVYHIGVRNNGPDAGAANAVFENPIPEGAGFVSAVSSQGTCSLQSGPLLRCELGDLAKNASALITLTLTAPTQLGFMESEARVLPQFPGNDPNLGNNSVTELTMLVPPSVDLSINKTGLETVPLSTTLTYTLSIFNHGVLTATAVTVTDQLPSQVIFLGATASQGSCALVNTTLTCTGLGPIPVGEGRLITITVRPIQLGYIVNSAIVQGADPDYTPDNNFSYFISLITSSTDMAISKHVTPTAATVGQPLTYTLRITNTGPGHGTLTNVTDTLPATVSLLSVSSSQGGCTTQTGNNLFCSLGTMNPNATAVITIVVIPGAVGTIINTAGVTVSEIDPNPNNNWASVSNGVTVSSDPYITFNPSCGEPGTVISVSGYNWHTGGPQYHYTLFGWPVANPTTTLLNPNWKPGYDIPSSNWTTTVTLPINTADGSHTIMAQRTFSPGQDTYQWATAAFKVPCPSANLVIGRPVLVTPANPVRFEPVTFRMVITNSGDLDVNSQFFIGLYFNPSPAPITSSTFISTSFRVGQIAYSGLSTGMTRTVTMTVQSGFTLTGTNAVYAVVDNNPIPIGVIVNERRETDNVSPVLNVVVGESPNPTPTPTPTVPPPLDPATLYGVALLRSASGQLLPQAGVTVRLRDGLGAIIATTETDLDGVYLISGLPPDNYTLMACIIINNKQYSDIKTDIFLGAGEVRYEPIELLESPWGCF
jgi:uncharacterized repeat protein (TIGR01451 family)